MVDLDRTRLKLAATRWGLPRDAPLPPELEVVGFVGSHRIALPFVLYYEGQSYTRRGAIADTVKPSLVLWYGFSAAVVWQNKEWFPGRPSRLRQLAETGY